MDPVPAPALADAVVILTPEEGTPMRPLGRAAIACSLAPDDDHRATLVAAFETVLDGLPDDDRPVILSHENLAGAMPGNACGLTTCGEWLGGQPSSQAVGFDPLLLMTPAQAPGESCEQVFPWLAASAEQPTVS